MGKFNEFLQKKALRVEKRFRFVISTMIMGLAVLFSTLLLFDKAVIFLLIFFVFGYLTTYFSLLEGIEGIEWLTLFIMPIILTVSFYLFYFLFPVRWLTRLPFMILYGISLYAVLLCSNIFNVGVEKSLQLYRAAFSINFFYQAIISFLFYNALFSFRFYFIFNALAVLITASLLAFQLVWSVKLDLKVDRKTVIYSLLIGLVMGELVLIGSFVPVKPTVLALFLASSYYSLSGLIYSHLDQRLFKETVREYVSVWLIVLLITFLSISW
ncbi:hypothetical protein A2767_03460 [Candidatus Roizmanbacteria bacterium RIFCSPHIGHO2_01_FULL_35_10]|uniref:Uncharacterized protein n=1 Tax=Candidatus Roizmanbacteria bacterium RIFCSPLOWO2_01_FULL_35_13 TaxID=1802055 RepID=A0A1F7IES6_9BACT|nr:MAG: hypothetical protein A2767_03460 [Candidatus Roizmanbacteria bacterium RIFCSPHIGHO2_01_FULL_35_10]OGK41860.1 MAG: hypothetical protein A3A74_02495 [Candidatus Roizmanbacteria bacterium RIFCSPLOWO2_01_FULL_35_13]